MPIPRDAKLKITREVNKKWQEIYGDREDTEVELANWEMLEKALAEAEPSVISALGNPNPRSASFCFQPFSITFANLNPKTTNWIFL